MSEPKKDQGGADQGDAGPRVTVAGWSAPLPQTRDELRRAAADLLGHLPRLFVTTDTMSVVNAVVAAVRESDVVADEILVRLRRGY